MPTYILPDGTPTRSAIRYGKAWQAIGKQIADLFKACGYNVYPIGYDPGVLLDLVGSNRSIDVNDSVMRVLLRCEVRSAPGSDEDGGSYEAQKPSEDPREAEAEEATT